MLMKVTMIESAPPSDTEQLEYWRTELTRTVDWVAYVQHPCATLEALNGKTAETTVDDAEPAEYTESVEYEVFGDWGVDGAEDEEDARRQVRQVLAAHPTCGAQAQFRVVRTWDDDAQYLGPWQPLPVEDGPPLANRHTTSTEA